MVEHNCKAAWASAQAAYTELGTRARERRERGEREMERGGGARHKAAWASAQAAYTELGTRARERGREERETER